MMLVTYPLDGALDSKEYLLFFQYEVALALYHQPQVFEQAVVLLGEWVPFAAEKRRKRPKVRWRWHPWEVFFHT